MNNKRRSMLKEAELLIDRASDILSNVLESEQDCLDNMPENLQMSERYSRMEEIVGYIEDSISLIGDVKNNIGEAIS